METVKRPSIKESDEDLLKQQKLFFKQKKEPAAKIVSRNSKESVHVESDTVTENSEEPANIDLDTQDTNELGNLAEPIISDVKEREVSSMTPFVFQKSPATSTDLSALINKNVKISKFSAKRKAQSIFSQLVEANKESETKEKMTGQDETKKDGILSSSVLVDGSGLSSEKDLEVKKIHEENVARISSMSKEEILHHQEQLKNYLRPEIIKFIQNKRKGRDQSETSEKNKIPALQNLRYDFADMQPPGAVLKKEGKKECDALILEKAFAHESAGSAVKKPTIDSTKKELNGEIEIPEETKEILKSSTKGLWQNMNKIEKDKLEWMTSLPQPKPIDLKTGYTARFDFEGKLLSRDKDIPTYEGLHHHGEEPEVPGYSLEELFLLARSTLQSQRVTALNTLAHILENNWYGRLDNCFDAPLLPMLLDAGIVPLLRWALDDTSLTSISATISALHSLLISKADEACLYEVFCWLNGHVVPYLEPQDLVEPNVVLEELTDVDLIKLDVIKGFLRIDILPRFMYILQVMCPPPLVCMLMLDICTHVAQHSVESAKQVAEHPRLLKLVFEKFLPLNWNFVDPSTLTDTVGYSCPMQSAMKLMRIISSSSKELAIYLVEKFGIVSNISFYLTIQPVDGKLPPKDVQMLVIETLKTWHVLLCYSLAEDVFMTNFPIFIKQLDFCLSLDLNCDPRKHLQDLDYATHLFKAFEAVAAVLVDQNNKRSASATALSVVLKKSVVCLKKWLWQFSQEAVASKAVLLLCSCMNFIVTFYKKSHAGLTCEDWEPCSIAKDAFEQYLILALKSPVFQGVMKNLKSFSLLLSSEISGNRRDGKTIVSLGSVMYKSDVVPVLKEGSPFPLLASVLNFIHLYKSFFHDTGNECFGMIFCCDTIDYLKDIVIKQLNSSNWFARYENFVIYQLIQLSSFVELSDSSLYYQATFPLLYALHSSEELLVQELFENVIFKKNVILNLDVSKSENSRDFSALQDSLSKLPVIAECYTSCFLSEKSISFSKSMLQRNVGLESLFCLSTPKFIIPKDWCFMPIFYNYQNIQQRKANSPRPEDVLCINCNLQWIFLCHALNLPVIQNIPASAEFYYLCLVFLVDEDLFREEKVKSLLTSCISLILEQKKLNLEKIKWNSIQAFDNLYLELLHQYEAVSYGDEVFGSVLALPLQRCFPSHWRKLILTEHASVLNFLRVPFNKLLVAVENYLEPVETEIEILSLYFKVLAAGMLNHRRCPLIFLMAIHHIHHFLLIESEELRNSQYSLLSKILKSKKELQQKILLYSKFDEHEEFGFSMVAELPHEHKSLLSSIMGSSVNIEL